MSNKIVVSVHETHRDLTASFVITLVTMSGTYIVIMAGTYIVIMAAWNIVP